MKIVKNIIYIILLFSLIFSRDVKAEDIFSSLKDEKFSLEGYVKYLGLHINNPNQSDSTNHLFQNRLNFKYFPKENIKVVAEIKTNILMGDSVDGSRKDKERINLTAEEVGSDYLLSTEFDRLYFFWEQNKSDITLGRQRINWSKTFVWNSNDIFNTYSFFNFDNEEKPSTDAGLFKYYFDISNSIEFAYSIDDNLQERVFAGIYKTNFWEYDFQFLIGGTPDDYVFGGGWAGQIKDVSFKGEGTYLKTRDKNDSSQINKDALLLSLLFTYDFTDEFSGMIEGFYNGAQKTIQDDTSQTVNITSTRSLTFNEYSLFTSLEFEITSLSMITFDTIFYLDDESYFIGPTFIHSLSNNTEFSTGAQIFISDDGKAYGEYGDLYYIRFKLNF
jgi:hypothetical protein